MKILTTLSTLALIATAAPAFAQANSSATSGPGTNSSQPDGRPGVSGGGDPKIPMEGRGSVNDTNTMHTMHNNGMTRPNNTNDE